MRKYHPIFSIPAACALALLSTACPSCTPHPSTLVEPSVDSREPSGVAESIPEIEQFMRILAAGDPSRAPDGTVYYTTFTTGVDQIYRLDPGGVQPVRLTDFEFGVDYYELSPDGRWIALGTSIGGSEQSDIHLLDVDTLEIRPLFADPQVRFENILWEPDSQGFYFRSNEVNGTDFFLYRYHLPSGSRSLLAETPGYNWLSDISADGRRILVTRYTSNANSDVFLYTLDQDGSATETLLTPHEGEIAYFQPFFDRQGEVWVMTNRQAPVMGIGLLVGTTGEVDWVVRSRWEVEEMVVSRDPVMLAYISNEEGYGRLHLVDMVSRQEVAVPELPQGIAGLSRFYPGHLMFTFSSPTQTGDVWVLDLAEHSVRQVTFSDYAGVDPGLFRDPILVHYPSFDGREIPAFLYLPPGYQAGPIPTIIEAHGGPEGQFRPFFNRHFQYLMLHGFALFAPNVRGSTGYGPEYMALDNYTLRRDSVRDYGAAVDWLVTQGYTDESLLGIKGASYGGYVVMACITEMPERFAAAWEEVGIVNFVTFLENTADYRRALREAEYGPLSDRPFLESISPIHHLDRIRAPLFVVHGENDPRVPVGEARQIIEALQARGQPVESLIFPDEGHGVSRLENRLVMYRAMVDFFTRALKR
ncbi:MAG: S9 family peptidase [Bradymonadales bacterium]|nr:S9 family peptidase [Bradymonadales bacterium]